MADANPNHFLLYVRREHRTARQLLRTRDSIYCMRISGLFSQEVVIESIGERLEEFRAD